MKKLYIMKCGEEKLYKIGISKCPEKRRNQLQTGNPHLIKIMFVFKIGDKYSKIKAQSIETIIHNFLKECNDKHVLNEWFKLSDNEVFKIAKCLVDNFK